MLGVIGQILPEAVGIALSPLPIIGLILILFTQQARKNSLMFTLGWLIGLAVVAAIVLLLVQAGAITVGEETTKTGVKWLALLLGLLLLFLAYRNWQKRPKAGEEPETPEWMNKLDSVKPGAAFSLGAALSGVNPKNLLLNVAAATAIAEAGLPTAGTIITLIVYILIASVTLIGPVVYYLTAGARAEEVLNELKVWLIQNNATIMAVLLLLIGVKLVGQGLGVFG
ncbi:MAG: GAP family protein [Anaerolineae bacterium]|nr:GAP family protein [Candidatus Roseilinea sp.]MDW8449887.1 GAP family protein [Anaerolineae bacterium]